MTTFETPITVGTGASTNDLGIAKLSSSLEIAIYVRAGTLYAKTITVSGVTLTANAEKAIDTVAGNINARVCALTSTKAMCVYLDASTDTRGVILTISGTDITVNTSVVLTLFGRVDLVTIDSSRALLVGDITNDAHAVVLSVSGTTITENTSVSYNAETDSTKAAVFSTSAAIVTWTDIPSTVTEGCILTISGTTLTAQAKKTIRARSIDSGNNVTFCTGLSSTKVFYGHIDTPHTYLSVLTLSGTSFNVGAETTLTTANYTRITAAPITSTRGIMFGNNGGTLTAREYFLSGAGLDELTLDGTDTSATSIINGWVWAANVDNSHCILHYDATTEAVIITATASAETDEYTMAPMTKPFDIDADDGALYIAALDSLGAPVLIKMNVNLASIGSLVFEPGAGDNIGVECSRFNADIVWVGGNFGTDKLSKSVDGGTTFTAKDDGTFADIEAFAVGPDTDDRVLVADETIEIQETVNSGDTWTQINASVGFNINAIARLGINVQECIFGNDADPSNAITYSPNSGDDMEDFTTGDFPTDADVTGVIVN